MRGLSGVTTGPEELLSEARDGSALPVDVRRAEEYAAGHVPGAVNVPLAGLLADDSPGAVARLAGAAGIGDGARVVAYDDTFGALASRLAWALELIGHRDVSLLSVTYSGWRGMGLEESTADPGRAAAPHSVSERPGIRADAGDVRAAAGSGEVLLDNRERLNYLERHIPGAVNLPYRALASPSGILRPPEETRRLLANRGIDGGRGVITYCGSVGTLSGLAYYALKGAGIPGVRLYVRSFREWTELGNGVEGQGDASYWDLSAE